MLTESVRAALYPLGYICVWLFGLRFAIQWWQSEKKGHSIVTVLFWKISLLANCLMAAHYLIQIHFTLCCIQNINAFLALRNIKLLHHKPSLTAAKRLAWVVAIVAGCSALFLAQSIFLLGYIDWIRSPFAVSEPAKLGLSWHIFGFLGAIIFSLRFWIQWWQAEETGRSLLHPWFWYLSLAGACCMSLYSLAMQDSVTTVSSVLPIAGYARNLYLAFRPKLRS